MTRLMFYPWAYLALWDCLSYCKAQQKFTASGQGQSCPSQQTLLMVSITNDSLLKGEANNPDKQVKLFVRLISSISTYTSENNTFKTTCLTAWREIEATCIAHAGNMHNSYISTVRLSLHHLLHDGLIWENPLFVPDLTTDALFPTTCLEWLIILEPNCQTLCTACCFSSNTVKSRFCCWMNLCVLKKGSSPERTGFSSLRVYKTAGLDTQKELMFTSFAQQHKEKHLWGIRCRAIKASMATNDISTCD